MITSRIAAIQMTSGTDVQKNLQQAEHLIKQAAQQGAQLIVLPENFVFMGETENGKFEISEELGHGPIQDFLATQAKQHNVWIVGGSMPIKSLVPNKVYNACTVYNDRGEQVACYNKIHLFDANVKPGSEVYEESKTIAAGKDVVVLDTPIGRLGLAICYDIRFPELFRLLAQQGAEIIAIPTAFTVKTGEAHWEVLTRARAIENFCYVIASCQTGTHENGRATYGHSMIIDPWGTVLACLPDEPGVISAEISLDHLKELRNNFPVHQHRKF
jgi:predicted amidohydrolase